MASQRGSVSIADHRGPGHEMKRLIPSDEGATAPPAMQLGADEKRASGPLRTGVVAAYSIPGDVITYVCIIV